MKPGTEEFWQRVSATVARLRSLSYYDLLGLDADPPPSQERIRDAYYGMVRYFHPDRYGRERDPERKRQLSRLYARIGEAYRVLARPDLREKYDRALAEGKRRLPPESEHPRARRPDPATEKARQLYRRGLELSRGGNASAARAQLELAAQFEPESEAIRRALDSLSEGGER